MSSGESQNLLVWYKLVDSDGNTHLSSVPSILEVPDNSIIDQFARRLCMAEPLLDGCSTTILKLYADSEALAKEQHLPGSIQLSSHHSSETAPLLVVVPSFSYKRSRASELDCSSDQIQLVTGFPVGQQEELHCHYERFREACFSLNFDALTYGGVIALPEGVYIMGCHDFGSKIFIRKPYPALHKMVLEMLLDPEEEKENKVILHGSPGIGKSLFGYLVAMSLIKAGKSVIFDDYMTNRCLEFPGDRWKPVRAGVLREFTTLPTSDAIYICDGCNAFITGLPTLLVTSPNRRNWYELSKASNCYTRYMPLWTLAELDDCRKQIFPDVTAEALEEQYAIWGGTARATLVEGYNPLSGTSLPICVMTLDAHTFREIVAFNCPDYAYSHNIIHMDVVETEGSTPKFDQYQFILASETIFETFMEDMRQPILLDMLPFIQADPEGILGSLGRNMFEILAQRVLASGIPLECRRVYPDGRSEACPDHSIGMRRIEVFQKEDTSLEDPQGQIYFASKSKTFESVDGLVRPNQLYQTTLALSHDVHLHGLEKALNLIEAPKNEPYKLFFVVPQAKFDDFGYQQLTKEGIHPVLEEACEDRECEQYVLGIPLADVRQLLSS